MQFSGGGYNTIMSKGKNYNKKRVCNSCHNNQKECQNLTDNNFYKNLSLKDLKERLKDLDKQNSIFSKPESKKENTYSYVLTTAKYKEGKFQQHGSAPNFEGGVLTLCTCKHRMRALGPPSNQEKPWKDYWITGFTSKSQYKEKQWLFYLAKIQKSYESHSDIWHCKELWKNYSRIEKCVSENPLGDIFEPENDKKLENKDRYEPTNYSNPCESHSHGKGSQWHDDIKEYKYKYKENEKKKHHNLLAAAEPKQTFIWTKPAIHYKAKITQGCKKFSLNDLINNHLSEGD